VQKIKEGKALLVPQRVTVKQHNHDT